MTLTVGQLRAQARLAAGGDPSTFTGYTVDERIAEIINHAGSKLFSHPWNFRRRTTVPLSLVAGQGYVELPSDVAEVLAVEPAESLGAAVIFVAPEVMARYKRFGVPGPGYFATYTHAASSNGQPTPRLDLHPTPAASEADALLVAYRLKWPAIDASTLDSVEVQVAAYAERILIAYVHAIAEGGEDGTTEARLAQIDAGFLLAEAKEHDGTLQPDYGQLPMQAGFTEAGGPRPWEFVAMRAISDIIAAANAYTVTVGDADWTAGLTYTYTISPETHMQGAMVRAAVFLVGGSTPDTPTSLTVGVDGTVTVEQASSSALKRTIVVVKQ